MNEQLTSVEEKLVQSENEKVTLQQRVELLLTELQSNDSQGNRLYIQHGIEWLIKITF